MLLLDTYQDVTCGGYGTVFSSQLPSIVHLIITVIEIGVPVLLIIFGMLDFGKAVMAQKEDEIKKGEQLFVKRLLAAALVFFVILITKVVFGLVKSDDEGQNIWSCVSCFVNGPTDAAKNAKSTVDCRFSKKK